jgi:hypothetical protein
MMRDDIGDAIKAARVEDTPAVRQDLSKRINMLRSMPKMPSAKRYKTMLSGWLKKLQTARHVVRSPSYPASPSEAFLAELDNEIARLEVIIGGIVVPPGAKPVDLRRVASVISARNFLQCHGQRPTLYEDGPWPSLAAIMLKAATGHTGNLFDLCRELAPWLDNPNAERPKVLERAIINVKIAAAD